MWYNGNREWERTHSYFATAYRERVLGDTCFECDLLTIGMGDTPTIPASGLWSSDAGLFD